VPQAQPTQAKKPMFASFLRRLWRRSQEEGLFLHNIGSRSLSPLFVKTRAFLKSVTNVVS